MTRDPEERPPRDDLLKADESELLAHCRAESYRGTGRGGQKRNVTDSAVRVTLTAYNLAATSDAYRSQHRNRRDALRRLRHKIALHVRCTPPGFWPWRGPPGPHHSDYTLWLAHTLDVLHACGYSVSAAAVACNLSTGQLVKALARDRSAWEYVNTQRRHQGLHLLRPPK